MFKGEVVTDVGADIDFTADRGAPQGVNLAGRAGTFYPADGKIRWDYLSVVGGQNVADQVSGQLDLNLDEPQLGQPPLQDGQ